MTQKNEEELQKLKEYLYAEVIGILKFLNLRRNMPQQVKRVLATYDSFAFAPPEVKDDFINDLIKDLEEYILPEELKEDKERYEKAFKRLQNAISTLAEYKAYN